VEARGELSVSESGRRGHHGAWLDVRVRQEGNTGSEYALSGPTGGGKNDTRFGVRA
jgi:hypothetical protein